jgi:hypothetical protein
MNLKHNYEGIQAWGRMQGSFPYYIQNQCIKADQDGAPEDAIYPKRTNQGDDTSEWNRIRDIESAETRHWFTVNYPALVAKFTDWGKETNDSAKPTE